MPCLTHTTSDTERATKSDKHTPSHESGCGEAIVDVEDLEHTFTNLKGGEEYSAIAFTTSREEMDLPTLDFSRYRYGSEKIRLELAVTLVKSFENHGFVKLINHGIPEETVYKYLKGV